MDGEILPSRSGILAEVIWTTIRPEFRFPTVLFISFAHDHSIKVHGPLSFIISFAHDHLTKIYDPLAFILSFAHHHLTKISFLNDLFIFFAHDHSTKIYDPLSFILSSFTTKLFDQKHGPYWFIFFYFHTAIWLNYIVLFHLFCILCTTIRPKN